MKNLMMVIIVALVIFAGVETGDAAILVSEGTDSTPGTIHEYASMAGSSICHHTTVSNGFTVDGVYRDNVWAAVFSIVDGNTILNGYGWSGYTKFRFTL